LQRVLRKSKTPAPVSTPVVEAANAADPAAPHLPG
jgi:hypothetical protein